MNYLETNQGKKFLKNFLKPYEGKGSWKVYRSDIVRFFKWHNGTLEEISRPVLEKYGKHLAETTGASTINRKFSSLNRFFKFLGKKVKDFSSPIKRHGDIQSFQSASYANSESFKRNLEQWKEYDKKTRASTKKTYLVNIRLFFNWAEKAPGDLKQTDFEKYHAYLKDCQQKPSTIWNKFLSVNSFLKFLGARRQNFKNPLNFKALELQRPPKAAGYDNVLEKFEIEAFLKAPDTKTLIGKRDHAILMLMIIYGPRAGEVCNLRWKDVDPQRVKGQQKITISDRKGKGEHTDFILNGKLLQAWDDWISNNDIGYKSDTPVFIGFRWDRGTQRLELNQSQIRKQKPLTVSTIEKIVYKYIEQAGIIPGRRALSPHALRHTAFTILSGYGIPLPTIKYIAGHQDIATTSIYTRHQESYNNNIGLINEFNK